MADTKDTAVVRVAAKRYWRAEDARVVLEAWRRSGETRSAFSSRYGIHTRRLRHWARKLEAAAESGEPGGSVRFHPMRLVPDDGRGRQDAEPIEIVLAEGSTVRVPAGFAAQDLERVLAVLELRAC